MANITEATAKQFERAQGVYAEVIRIAAALDASNSPIDKDCKTAVGHAKQYGIWYSSLVSLRQPLEPPTEPAALREKAKNSKNPRKKVMFLPFSL